MTETEPTPHTGSLEELQAGLAAINTGAAGRYNPARCRFIESMLARALAQSGQARELIAKKALTALQSYQADFEQAQQAASDLVEQVVAEFPQCAEALHGLFEEGEFRALNRRAALLARAGRKSALSAITDRLVAQEDGADETPGESSIEDILLRQEKELLHSASPAQQDVSGPGNSDRTSPAELKSARRFRQSREKHSTEKRVGQAVRKSPEDSGPLNSHRLIVSSLATMRDISPDYTSRLVTYIDTLLWLEQADMNTLTER